MIHEIFFSSFSFELNNERSNHWIHRPEVKVMQLWTSTAECYERSLLFKLIIDASNQSWKESEFKFWYLWFLNTHYTAFLHVVGLSLWQGKSKDSYLEPAFTYFCSSFFQPKSKDTTSSPNRPSTPPVKPPKPSVTKIEVVRRPGDRHHHRNVHRRSVY